MKLNVIASALSLALCLAPSSSSPSEHRPPLPHGDPAPPRPPPSGWVSAAGPSLRALHRGDDHRHHHDLFLEQDREPKMKPKPEPVGMKPNPKLLPRGMNEMKDEHDPKSEPEPKPKPEPKLSAGGKPEPKPKPEPKLSAGGKPEPKPKPEPKLLPALIGGFKQKPGPKSKPEPKPKPEPFLGMMKPKPKPNPKPKPGPAVFGKPTVLSSSHRDVEEAADIAQDQCQRDYSRLCAQSFVGMNDASTPSPLQQVFFFDFVVMDKENSPVASSNGRGTLEPCGEDGDDQSYANDDDYYDDEYYDDDDYNDENNFFDPKETSADELFAPDPFGNFLESFFSILPQSSGQTLPRSRVLTSEEEIPMSIGYGFDGDMCLLDKFDLLSRQCQQSIQNLEAVTEVYNSDEEHMHCPLVPILLLLLALSTIWRCVARRRLAKRMNSMQKTLAAIHASPELKAKVEAASGVPLPPNLPHYQTSDKPLYVKVIYCISAFVLIFALAINAVLVTNLVAQALSSGQDDDVYAGNVSPLAFFLILISVVMLEVLTVKLLAHALSSYFNSSSSPPPTASTGMSGGIDHDTPAPGNLALIFHKMRSVQLSSLLPKLSRSSSQSSGEYVPLLSEDLDTSNTEMVSASAPPSNEVSNIPVVVTPVQYVPPNVKSSISLL